MLLQPSTNSLETPKCCSDAYKLLALIAALGGMIPETILQRLQREQKRWTVHGEIGVLTPSEAGLDSHLQKVISPYRVSEFMAELMTSSIQRGIGWDTSTGVFYSIKYLS